MSIPTCANKAAHPQADVPMRAIGTSRLKTQRYTSYECPRCGRQAVACQRGAAP